MNTVIAYFRVSTEKQGRSGLGLDAQREAVQRFAEAEGMTILGEHTEVETAKGVDALERRPELRKALAAAKKSGAAICVAKLDRLSRDVEFIAGLMKRRVPFVVADLGRLPDPFILHLFASLAEKERAMISQRTKAALARKRERGEPLGHLASLEASRGKGAAVNRAAAAAFAANVLPIIREIQAAGHTSLRAIAGELTRRDVRTARGGAWSADAVRAVLLRA